MIPIIETGICIEVNRIRYYFPKGTDFAKVSDEDIRAVEWELNNRPRKRLGYKTPMEKLREYL